MESFKWLTCSGALFGWAQLCAIAQRLAPGLAPQL